MSFILSHWPLTFICAAMIVAAVIDGWKLKVPNWLTFPLVFSGWALGLLHNFDLLVGPTGVGGIGASLAGTMLGFALLIPVYAIGGMGAGDVKMQMGFGAWVGAFYGFDGVVLDGVRSPSAQTIIFWSFLWAVVIGGALAVLMIVARRNFRTNLSNARAILTDLVGGVSVAAEKAAERKPTMHLLPYGIPLCLGFVSYLVRMH